MIETLMMAGSLAILGYAFYISSRMFWSSKEGSGAWKFVYVLVSAFIIATYVVFAFVMLTFLTDMLSSSYVFESVNMVLGILLLSGSALVGALMKYHLSDVSVPLPAVSSSGPKPSGRAQKKKANKAKAAPGGAESKKLRAQVESLKKDLDAANVLNKIAVGRELRMMELKKRIEELEGKPS